MALSRRKMGDADLKSLLRGPFPAYCEGDILLVMCAGTLRYAIDLM